MTRVPPMPKRRWPPHGVSDISTQIRKLIAWDLHEMKRKLVHEPLEDPQTRRLARYAQSLHHLNAAEARGHAPGCACPDCRQAVNTAESVLRTILADHPGDEVPSLDPRDKLQ